MRNGGQPSRDDILPFSAFLAVQNMRRTPHSWSIRNPANETGRGLGVRPLSEAPAKPARPRKTWSDFWARIISNCDRQRNCCSGAGCRVRHPESRPEASRSVEGGARVCAEAAQVPDPCPFGVFLAADGSSKYLFFCRHLCGGSKLPGTI
jgi:hypothetical protein